MGKGTEYVVGISLSVWGALHTSCGLGNLEFRPVQLQFWDEIGITLVTQVARVARVAARIVVLGIILGIACWIVHL